MRNFILGAIIAALFAAGVANAAPSKDSQKSGGAVMKGFIMKTIEVGKDPVKYVVYVPPTYDPAKVMPAIVFLNGAGECGTDGLKQIAQGIGTSIQFNIDKWPFLVIFPQKQDVRHAWEDEDAMVMAILDQTRKEYSIDNTRLYLTGISQGGHGTWTIGAKHSDIWAAIAPVCGWADEATAKKLAEVKMPIWNFHGDADQAVNIQSSLDMEKWIKAAGGEIKMSIYPGVNHNSWDKAYREENLNGWFLEHHK